MEQNNFIYLLKVKYIKTGHDFSSGFEVIGGCFSSESEAFKQKDNVIDNYGSLSRQEEGLPVVFELSFATVSKIAIDDFQFVKSVGDFGF